MNLLKEISTQDPNGTVLHFAHLLGFQTLYEEIRSKPDFHIFQMKKVCPLPGRHVPFLWLRINCVDKIYRWDPPNWVLAEDHTPK